MTTSFRDGKKWVDGRALNPLKLVHNGSKSSPRVYTTIFWEDATTSCNCKGWATHKHCTHTRELEDSIERGVHGRALQAIKQFPPTIRVAGLRLDAVEREARFMEQFEREHGFPYESERRKSKPKKSKQEPEVPKPYRRIRL